MAMTPAEPSRPGRKWLGSRLWVEGPFWAGVVILLFLAGLIVLAESGMEATRILVSDDYDRGSGLMLPLAGCILGIVIVAALLTVFARHPKTRSDAATVSFTAMEVLMFLAGVVLFLGGASQIIETDESAERIILALLSVFYMVTPLSLHFIAK